MEEGFEIKYPRSSKTRLTAKCAEATCKWVLRAYVLDDSKRWHVRRLVDEHTCSSSKIYPNHHNANKKVLGSILKEVMLENSRIYRGKEIMTDMAARFKIDISYHQAWRAKCYALKLLRGTPEQSFAELPLYCHNLKLKNPGTVTYIQTDEYHRFELFFLAIGAAVSI